MTDYEVLGIQPDATPEQVKHAFRVKAMQLHPDLNPAPDAGERFKELMGAYQRITTGQPNMRPVNPFEGAVNVNFGGIQFNQKDAEEIIRIVFTGNNQHMQHIFDNIFRTWK